MSKLIFGFVLVCFLLVTSPSVLADSMIYDDFSGSTLNLSKWEETTDCNFPAEHFVDTAEQVYHIAQPSIVGDTALHLIMKEGLTDQTIEYDLEYVSGSGNHLHNFWLAPYGEYFGWCSGNCYIGYWNAPGIYGSDFGTYHIKFEFNSTSEEVNVSVKRPDGTYWTNIADLSSTNPPYHLLIQASTGHNGLMHFDIDNVVITTPELEPTVAYWKFDEGTGIIAHDETGNHDGTIVGALWTSGINGTGLLFDGLDDSVCVGDSDDLDLTNQGTLEAWIKTLGNGDYYSIICKAIGWKYHEFAYCFEWDKPVWGGRLLLVFDDGVNQQELISNTPILDNEFHHVAATWDGNTIDIFIDGELDASIEQQVIPRGTDYPLCVGNLGGSMNSFEGVIDEVRISNVALDPSEFLYQLPSIPTVAYWKFDEGTGTIAHDETGIHNGTLVNGPLWTTGINGNALWFDGINDYVVVPDSSSFSSLDQMTVEASIKLDSFNPGVKHIVGKADGRPYHPGDEWSLQILDHTIAFYVSNGSTIYSSLFRAEAEVNETDTWYYITGVWNGTNFALYINDKLADSGTSLQGTSQDSNVPVYIGAMPDWSWTFFDGIIDEVRISNKALNPSEFLYQPSCDNGVQDGDEEGIDCGGSCPEPCPLTLEERVEQLEQENLNQQQQIMNLTQKNEILQEEIETLKNQIQNNTQRISALEILVSSLQATINTIQETLSNIVDEIKQTIANYLSNLPKGLRQQMICGALEQTNMSNSTGFGLYCEINEKGCKCQEL